MKLTTRAPLLDLIDYRTYTHREVEHLSENEGVELLQKLGVNGNESELRQVVRQWVQQDAAEVLTELAQNREMV